MPFAEPADNPWKNFKPLHCERPETSNNTMALLVLVAGLMQILGGIRLCGSSILPSDPQLAGLIDALLLQQSAFPVATVLVSAGAFLWALHIVREHR